MRKRAMEVRFHHERKSDGVRVDHEKENEQTAES